MFKTVKSKVSLIYMLLVAIILLLGIVSLWDMAKISSAIAGLVVTNYNSIKRLTGMKEDCAARRICFIPFFIWRIRTPGRVSDFLGPFSALLQDGARHDHYPAGEAVH
jgi:hypothetical protein